MSNINDGDKQVNSEKKYTAGTFGTIFDLIDSMISVINLHGGLEYANRSLRLLLGRRRPGSAETYLSGVHEDDRGKVETAFQRTLRTKKRTDVSYRMVIPKGMVRDINALFIPEMTPRGSVKQVVSVCRDVTEKLVSQNEMRLLANAVSCTKDSFVLTDLGGNILYLNQSATQSFGSRGDDLIGGKIDLLFSDESWKKVSGKLPRSSHPDGWNGEVSHIRRDGSIFSAELWIAAIPDDAGKPVAIAWTSRDTTERNMAESNLRETAVRLDLIADNLNILLFELNLGGTILYSGGRGLAKLNLPPGQLRGNTIFRLYEKDSLFRTLFDAAARGESGNADLKLGGLLWETNIVPMKDLSGEIVKIFVTAIDITGRKAAEETLRVESELWRSLMDTIPDTIYFKDADSKFTKINKAQADVLGISREAEAIGKTDAEFFAEDHVAVSMADERRVIGQGEKILGKVEKVISKSGKVHWFTTSKVPLRDENGTIIGIVGSSRDITNLKQAEDLEVALYRIADESHSNRDLSNLFATIHQIIGELMYAKNFYIALYDPTDDSLTFPYFVDEVDLPPERGTAGKGLTAFVLRKGRSLLCDQKVSDELEARGDAVLVGVPAPIWLGVPLKVEGKTIGAMVVQHYSDPTVYGERELHILEFVSNQVAKAIESKQVQSALRASDVRYRAFISQSTEGIWRFETANPIDTNLGTEEQVGLILKSAVIAECNDAMAQMYGYSLADEFIGTKMSNMLDPTDSRNIEILRSFVKSDYRLTGAESRELDKYGNVKIFLNNLVGVIEDGLMINIWGTQTDITEKRHAEELIINSEAKYRTLFEESQDAILLTTPDGVLLDINQAGIELFGYLSRDEMLKLNDAGILYFDPNDREQFIGRLEQFRFVRDLEVTIRRKDGEKRFVLENASAVFDKDGNVTAYRSFLRDITERKTLEEQLRQAQKMESIGTLAGGIAHDFNNILGIILGYTSLLQKGTTDPQRVSQSLETIKKSVQRGADLVRQLLTFARKGEPEFSSVNINDIISELIKILNQTFPKTIRIESDLLDRPPSIIADSSQLHLALLNLCVNARDAITTSGSNRPGGGVLTLSTSIVSLEKINQKFPKANAKYYVSVSVKDTGIGMDDETRNRIFEPFFTTKELGKGTGLGLAVVYGVINSHHGIIDVVSGVGAGTTFTLFFPAVESEVNEENQQKSTEEIKTMGDETILIVEDEEMLAVLLSSIITDQGYNVLVAKDGAEGVEAYKNNPGKINLVLSDMGLPKLGGYEMFMKMKELDNDVTAILASGYFEPNLKKELLAAGAKDFIQKPYVPELILQRIREVLDEKKNRRG